MWKKYIRIFVLFQSNLHLKKNKKGFKKFALKKINTVRYFIITFFIVFTNKNVRMDLTPPPS